MSDSIATLYDGVGQPWLDVPQVRHALAAWLPGLAPEIRGELLHPPGHAAPEELAERLCRMRVQNPTRPVAPRRPLKLEVDVEKRLLAGQSRPTPGVLYDGNELQRLAFTRLPPGERRPDAVHVWFTERLVATWDHADRRYHARVIVCGLPAIISTTGMVQAPARQREFYLARRLGLSDHEAADAATEDFLGHEDRRTTEVAKGYALQAALYSLLGEGFCDQPGCRLFNAHWQREMLAAQLEGHDFCPRHRQMLDAEQRANGPERNSLEAKSR